MNLKVKLGKIELQNPIMTASGTFGYGEEFAELIDLNELGGMCIKGTTKEERQGNPMPRIYETASGMLNAIGFQNVGLDRFISEKYPYLSNEILRFTKSDKSLPFSILFANKAMSINCFTLGCSAANVL